MELRDKNGLTEKEFLASYSVKDYPRPSVTADILIFAKDKKANGQLKLLMIQRGGHPCLGMWALVGGFANPDESVEKAAARELLEETHVEGLPLEQIGLFSDPNRDLRAWVMTCAYMSVADMEQLDVKADDDAQDTCWFDVSLVDSKLELRSQKAYLWADMDIVTTKTAFGNLQNAEIKKSEGIAFDHAKIITTALLKLKQRGVI